MYQVQVFRLYSVTQLHAECILNYLWVKKGSVALTAAEPKILTLHCPIALLPLSKSLAFFAVCVCNLLSAGKTCLATEIGLKNV